MLYLRHGLTPLSSSAILSLKPPLSFSTSLSNFHLFYYYPRRNPSEKIIRRELCRADFSHDVPFSAAIGVSVLSSLLLPVADRTDTEELQVSGIDSTDSRLAVMGIISFIPFFNWLSWVFAWLDTGKRRYAVYSLVYLAPYLRSNFSVSPDESWLPIASILLCIIHVQLEASIRNGDLQGFQLFSEAAKRFPSVTGKKEIHLKRHGGISEEKEEDMNLPSANQQSRNEIQSWGGPEKPRRHVEQLNEDGSENESKKQ